MHKLENGIVAFCLLISRNFNRNQIMKTTDFIVKTDNQIKSTTLD